MNCFVIADSRRCIGCFACQAACVENHRRVGFQAYPRLIVTNELDGTMPVQCRHCEDAPCAVVCPVKAIVLKDNSIQLNESLCIGCKMCGLACPFGVILPGGTPVPTLGFNIGQYSYVNTPYQSDPMHLREMNAQDFLSLLGWHIGQKKVAVKCDLCYFDEEGPACIRVCPHKALSLIEEETDENAERVSRIKEAASIKENGSSKAALSGRGED
jgi:hydrogenase-4 component A